MPHHLSYKQGRRGVNWDIFEEGVSPVVELYSMHGCSENDQAEYPFCIPWDLEIMKIQLNML